MAQADSHSEREKRRKQRRLEPSQWPNRRFDLGSEPTDDLTAVTTAAERLAMVWPLTIGAGDSQAVRSRTTPVGIAGKADPAGRSPLSEPVLHQDLRTHRAGEGSAPRAAVATVRRAARRAMARVTMGETGADERT